ncbi:hypothetical protein DVA67_029525 [Solirubrobacter sp. CPCC 204708]|uniref:DUF4389 domain-containing protein n=1 Tax=Solirubrobacter deserti TaxID=2282478 RepID=A0ABT4RMS7_9ACTN|nr:hypothetical protein [Solirubrobacter deserti]MBE2320143.1 hypothetical protein [Solirubrobacter deserti]MDA0139863.1 hypothetical protein [Solirubrobacter deserti]
MNSNPSGGRLAALVTGGVLASLAVVLLAVGASFAWLDDRKDADGYYMTDSERFSTSTYALATENFDVDHDLPGVVSGTVRFDVRPNGGKPVFVGIARSRDVKDYLAASAHATLTDVEVDPFAADYRMSDGNARPAAPAGRDIWVAQAQGSGPQRLDWDVEGGDWSVVVMNADGSPAVDAGVAVGSDVPLVGTLKLTALISGVVLLVGGAGLMVGGALAPRRRSPLAV